MAFEGLRDRWDHMAPRERNLVAVLGVALVGVVFLVIASTISSGLAAIEASNEDKRLALENLVLIKQRKTTRRGPTVTITSTAPSLSTYLEGIANEVGGVQIPNYQPQPSVARGSYEEISGRIELREVTIYQLAEFLEKVETKNRTVVVTTLNIEKSRREPDKLRKATMVVSTFRKLTDDAAEDENSDG